MAEPLRLTVYPKNGMTPAPPGGQVDAGDPYAAYSDAPPVAANSNQGDPYAAYADVPPPAKEKGREIGAGESFGKGALEGITFGAFPAIHGVMAAGMTPEEYAKNRAEYESGNAPDAFSELHALVKGLGRLGYEHLIAPALGVDAGGVSGLVTGDHAGPATKAYRTARDRAKAEQDSASEQSPKSYIAGQLAGAIATPAMGAIKGVGTAARVLHAGKSGAISGGLYGAGEALSEGKDLPDIAVSGAKGAGTGAAFGAGGAGLIHAGSGVVKRVGQIARGAKNTDNEAARQVTGALVSDVNRAGPGIDAEAAAAARQSGMPLGLVDLGGQKTRDLARTAGNNSSEAWAALQKLADERIEGRPERIHGAINRLFGGGLDSKLDQEAIKARARVVNRPRYASAYRMGDRPVWSPEMERLTGSPAIQAAMKSAITTGKDKAIKDGFGAFNPGVKVTQDGRLKMGRSASGVPTYQNLQFWDYVQRDLKDMATKVEGRENDKAATLNGLHHDLNAELDKLVPEFQLARRGAANFFKAEDASEAGKKFVMMNADPREARRALAAMSPAERELFARGFADELAQSVLRSSNTMGTIKRAFTAPLAREKIEAALGAARAKELEALLRAETIGQRVKEMLGNSTTARQLKQLGMSAGHGAAGAGAVAGLESLREADYDPKYIIGTALIVGGLKHGAAHIDAKVARRIGEMLASNDVTVLHRGAQAVARSPQLFNALRNGTEAGMRVAAHDIGANRTLAAGAAILEHILAEEESGHHPHDDITNVQPAQQ